MILSSLVQQLEGSTGKIRDNTPPAPPAPVTREQWLHHVKTAIREDSETRAYRAYRALNKPMTILEWADKLGLHRTTLSNYYVKLNKLGLVTRYQTGKTLQYKRSDE